MTRAQQRANKAIKLMTNAYCDRCNAGKYLGRNFDNCFENGDGENVVLEIMKQYNESQYVKKVMEDYSVEYYISLEKWKQLYAKQKAKQASLFLEIQDV